MVGELKKRSIYFPSKMGGPALGGLKHKYQLRQACVCVGGGDGVHTHTHTHTDISRGDGKAFSFQASWAGMKHI